MNDISMEDPLLRSIKLVVDADAVNSVHSKTREMIRLMGMRLPVGGLRKAEASRQTIAIELSCRVLSIPFNKAKLTQQAAVNAKDYQQALVTCKNVLNLQWTAASTIDILSVQFGVSLKPSALKNLEDFKRIHVDRLDKIIQATFDLSSSVYHARRFRY